MPAGADANGQLPGGETPLMTAARTGTLPVVKALLSHGAVVDSKDERRGQTALIWAAADGHAAVVHRHGARLAQDNSMQLDRLCFRR